MDDKKLAEYITVAYEVLDRLGIDMNSDFVVKNDIANIRRNIAKIGKDFCDFVEIENPRHVFKMLRFDLLGLPVLSFGFNTGVAMDTKKISIRSEDGKAMAQARLVRGKLNDRDREPLFVLETFGEISDRFVLVDLLESMSENAGSNLLNDIVYVFNRRTTKVPILIQAGWLYFGDYYQGIDVKTRLVKFYEKLGFENLNGKFSYSDSVIMMYGRENGNKISAGNAET